MNIASKCRHPHLLQFIGATKDEGTPLFVTELMEKSLRTLLDQRQLSETEIAVISLDVTLALNYLHQKKPEPIIHRDVSSANVLLSRQGATSSPGRFSLALGAGREKALASAGRSVILIG